MTGRHRQIVLDGLWFNNQALVALLGLCPLLAVSNTLVNGLGLGLATTLVITLSNGTVALIRNWVRPEIRVPVYVLVIASFVTAVELAMHAWLHELHQVLGIFIPLIVTNCAILGRAEAFASRNPVPLALLDGVSIGIGFTAVLVVLGASRELIGQGTLLADAQLMFGEGARAWVIDLGENWPSVLMAILPPGAFIGLGMLIALKNLIDRGIEARRTAAAADSAVATEGGATPSNA